MKKIKLLIWIVILTILDVSLTRYIRIFNAAPLLSYAFLICVAMSEEDFTTAALVGGICGVLCGSLLGRSFYFIFIFYSLSAALVYYMRLKPRYFGKMAKAVVWCGILSFLYNVSLIMIESRTMGVFVFSAVFFAVYNMFAALAIYPILQKTIYKNEEQKQNYFPQ